MDAVETPAAMGAAAAPTATGRRWAPRLGRMLVFTALMLLSPNAMQLGFRDRGDGFQSLALLGMLALTVFFALLAHRDYVVARRALRADPSLRGGWIVENAWWVVYLVLVVPAVVGFALAVWILPRL
jgi:hypothetical protein